MQSKELIRGQCQPLNVNRLLNKSPMIRVVFLAASESSQQFCRWTLYPQSDLVGSWLM